jgi:hypothetical protein
MYKTNLLFRYQDFVVAFREMADDRSPSAIAARLITRAFDLAVAACGTTVTF